jgi:DNA-binding NarL/FixJ family response regulator
VNGESIRILVVDDHPSWRSFVVGHLRHRAMEIVATACDGAEAIQRARTLKPDVILMDVWMPRLSGIHAARVICDLDPSARVLIVTNEQDPAAVDVALSAGVRGYILKRTAALELIEAIQTVARGEQYIGRGLSLP